MDQDSSITKEELLTAENLSLRAMMQRQRLVTAAAAAEGANGELAAAKAGVAKSIRELEAYRDMLSDQYDIDFEKYELEAGTGKLLEKE